MKHEHSLDTLCAALTTAMGIEAPENAAPANEILVDYVNKTLGGSHGLAMDEDLNVTHFYRVYNAEG